MYRGYIKVWRKTLESDMYKSLTSTQRDIFIALLLLANHKPKTWEWKGETYACQQGQFITSLESIKKLCSKKVTVRNTRTALNKFTRWQFLTNESTKTGRLITILNWDTYQGTENKTDKENDKAPTKHRQTGDKQVTTNKNDKNVKKEKYIKRNSEEKVFLSEGIKEVLDLFNKKREELSGKNLKPLTSDKLIKQRFNAGHTVFELCRIIELKARHVEAGKHDILYYTPETLFGNRHFAEYLGQADLERA